MPHLPGFSLVDTRSYTNAEEISKEINPTYKEMSKILHNRDSIDILLKILLLF